MSEFSALKISVVLACDGRDVANHGIAWLHVGDGSRGGTGPRHGPVTQADDAGWSSGWLPICVGAVRPDPKKAEKLKAEPERAHAVMSGRSS